MRSLIPRMNQHIPRTLTSGHHTAKPGAVPPSQELLWDVTRLDQAAPLHLRQSWGQRPLRERPGARVLPVPSDRSFSPMQDFRGPSPGSSSRPLMGLIVSMGALRLRETACLGQGHGQQEQGRGEASCALRRYATSGHCGSDALALERVYLMAVLPPPNPWPACLPPRGHSYLLSARWPVSAGTGEKVEMGHSVPSSLICLKSWSPKTSSRSGLQQNKRLGGSRPCFPKENRLHNYKWTKITS